MLMSVNVSVSLEFNTKYFFRPLLFMYYYIDLTGTMHINQHFCRSAQFIYFSNERFVPELKIYKYVEHQSTACTVPVDYCDF